MKQAETTYRLSWRTSTALASLPCMGDVKLSAHRAAQVLKKLDESARSVSAVRSEIIGAMAERRREPQREPRSIIPARKKRR